MRPDPFGLANSRAEDRIQLLDAARGLCVVVMVVYHLCFDLWCYGLLPGWGPENRLLQLIQFFFASCFLFISGICCRFSRSNVRRGGRVIGWALVVTLVSWAVGAPIWFGILHLLGCAMLLYGAAGDWLERRDPRGIPLFCGLGLLLTLPLVNRRFPVYGLFWLGLPSPTFTSADYYPLLPWLFVFLLGTWAGGFVKQRRLPDWFYTRSCPLLPAIGRKSLLIYLLHQPVCFAAAALLARTAAK